MAETIFTLRDVKVRFHTLDGAVEAVEAPVGKGTLYLFAPEITFRGQPHGTFKWLFNGIYSAKDAPPVP